MPGPSVVEPVPALAFKLQPIQLTSWLVRNCGVPIRDLPHSCNGPAAPGGGVATCQEAPWSPTSAGVQCDKGDQR